MELYLVIPLPEGATTRKGDEKLNDKWWRVKGPIDSAEISTTKFHCVSYVWGQGIDRPGSFFDCQRDISDRTKPALEAAMKAADTIYKRDGGERVDAFWIDAICVPQVAGAGRHGTLERCAKPSYSKSLNRSNCFLIAWDSSTVSQYPSSSSFKELHGKFSRKLQRPILCCNFLFRRWKILNSTHGSAGFGLTKRWSTTTTSNSQPF